MPLPPPLTTVTVRGRALDAVDTSDQPATLTFIPLAPATSPTGQVLVTPRAIQARIQDDGTIAEITGVLLTDSPGLSNRISYLLEISAPGFRHHRIVELLSTHAVDGVIRLDQLVPPSQALVG